MAGRGPTPKPEDERVRRNKRTPSEKVTVDGVVRGPALPADLFLTDKKTGEPVPVKWHAQTVSYYEGLRRSPLSVNWIDADWAFLIDTMLMHHEMWTGGRWDFASEVRLRLAKFGATPDDRARMHIDVVTTPTPAPRRSPAGSVTDISSRRARLAG